MKTLKFSGDLPGMILSGRKTVTWRIHDEKAIEIGDVIECLARPALNRFATIRVTNVRETTFGEFNKADTEWHESFSTEKEMYETYSRYYSMDVNPTTRVKVITFVLLEKL
jgi:hypothetical protein